MTKISQQIYFLRFSRFHCNTEMRHIPAIYFLEITACVSVNKFNICMVLLLVVFWTVVLFLMPSFTCHGLFRLRDVCPYREIINQLPLLVTRRGILLAPEGFFSENVGNFSTHGEKYYLCEVRLNPHEVSCHTRWNKPCIKNWMQQILGQFSTSTCCHSSWIAAITRIHKSGCHYLLSQHRDLQ